MLSFARGLVIAFVTSSAPAVLTAQTFDWFYSVETGFRTSAVATGDLDRDGDTDLVFAVGEHFYEPQPVFRNNGFGNFSRAQELDMGRGQDVALGDLNGDGWLDAAFASDRGDQNTVWLNDGTGLLQWANRFGDLLADARAIILEDMDGDGDLDAVVGNRRDQDYVYLNDGEGVFADRIPFGLEDVASFWIAVGDVNGDGWLDVVNFDRQARSARSGMFFGLGDGSVGPRQALPTEGEAILSGALADVDGDEDLDLIVAVCFHLDADGRGRPGGQNYILLNDGAGNWEERRLFGTGTDLTETIEVADLDGDGDVDILAGDNPLDSAYEYLGGKAVERFFFRHNGGGNTVYVNDGKGNFSPGAQLPASHVAEEFAVADVSGDGFLDIVVASKDGSSTIHLNSLGDTPPWNQ